MTTRAVRLGIAVLFAVSAALAAPAAPAGAAATHVGIVVRFADGSSRTACTTTGGNGFQVLARKFTPTIGTSGPYAGFLLAINNSPAKPHPDNTHFWSYWHSAGNGSWTWSGSGGGSFTPIAGTVEGWSYVNGQSSAPRPPAVTYASLCSSSDPKPKSTSPTHRASSGSTPASTRSSAGTSVGTTHPSTPRSSTSAAHRPTSTTATLPAGQRSTAGTAGTASTASTAASSSRHGTDVPSSTASSAAAGVTSGGSPSRTAASLSAAAGTIRAADPPTHRSAAGFPAWGTALGLLVVLALGGTALLRSRRRPE